jgi:hypothetical protein
MAASAEDQARANRDGVAHRVRQRTANRRKSSATAVATDAQGLVEFACECTRVDCERVVKVPLDVYRRMVEGDQYVLQAGHHAFANYRTIVSVGLMRIEERVRPYGSAPRKSS